MNESDFVGIGKIQLSNFKSIKREPIEEIELAPLTLLCGENSSGKSTVLHSILLQLQSLSLDKTSRGILPFNGSLIKLNSFMNILHAIDDFPPGNSFEEVLNSEDFEMNLGISFNTFYGNNMKMAPYFRQLNNFKINLHLKPESSYEDPRGPSIAAFPNNDKTIIEKEVNHHNVKNLFNPDDTILDKERFNVVFSKIPTGKVKVKVFEYVNEEPKLKQFSNEMWQCTFRIFETKRILMEKTLDQDQLDDTGIEEYHLKYDETEEEAYNQVFGGVEFKSGVPSKVFDRVLLSDYLAKKHTEQIKVLAEDTNRILDSMQWIEDVEDISGLEGTDLMDEGKLIPTESSESIADRIANHYTLLNEEDFNKNIREGLYQNSKDEVSEDAFALHWNVAPWANANYNDFYTGKDQLARDLIECFNSSPFVEHEELLDSVLGSFAVSYIYDIVEYNKSFDDVREVIEKNLKEIFNNKFFNYLEVELSKSFQSIFDEDKEDTLYFFDDTDNENLDFVNEMLGDIRNVAKDVRYLGPLRMLENDEKRVSSYDHHTPIGINGEYFFNFHYDQNSLKFKSDEMTISESFNKYLKFFEIAESFSSEYVPETDTVVGYIKPIGLDKNIKMTDLGVGFSQLAPIILLCITSSPGTTILLEQPELHLHPKVQQKFADFIIEMIEKNDLQIILETHSDHILNRIRRRVAQAKIEENDSSLFQKCAILFAERENGVTSFRKAKLTDSGMFDLTDYPDGFFDQGAEDAFYILKASLEDGNS